MIKNVVQEMKPMLETLPLRLRVAFITYFAERAIRSYQKWVKDEKITWAKPDLLIRSVEQGWAFAEGKDVDIKYLALLSKQIVEITPHTEEYPNASGAGALDAPEAVKLTIEYLLNPTEISYCFQATEATLFASDILTDIRKYIQSFNTVQEHIEFEKERLKNIAYPLAREYRHQREVLQFLGTWSQSTISKAQLITPN